MPHLIHCFRVGRIALKAVKASYANWFVMALLIAGVVALNWFALPMHDELAYAFAGQLTPMTGEVPRCASLSDLVRQQIADYCGGQNGRVLVHTPVIAFSMARAYHLFDLLNAAVWMLFVLCLMWVGNVKLTLRNYLAVWLAAFALLWYSQSCSFDADFATNYLWTAALTLVAIRMWERERCSAAFFLLFGLTQETFVLPFLAAGCCTLSRKRTPSWLAMLLGASTLVLAPAARARILDSYASDGGGLLSFALGVLSTIPRAALYVAPVVLAVLLAVVWHRTRVRKPSFLVLFLLASAGMSMLLCRDFSPRLMMPTGIAAFVLILRHRALLPNFARPHPVILWCIGAWFMLSVAMQVASGLDNARMLTEYRASTNGLAHRHYIPVFGYTADRGQFTPWHLRLLALEHSKPFPPQLCPSPDFPSAFASHLRLRHFLPACLYSRIQYLIPDPQSLCQSKD